MDVASCIYICSQYGILRPGNVICFSNLEVTSEGAEEVFRVHAEHSLMGVVLPCLAVVDLLDDDIRQGGVVEEPGESQSR